MPEEEKTTREEEKVTRGVLEKLVASPIDVKIDGVTYVLAPPNVEDLSALKRWGRDRLIEEAKATVRALQTGDPQPPDSLLDGIWGQLKLDLEDPTASNLLDTPEAMREFAMLCLHRGQPHLNPDDIRKMISTDVLIQMRNQLDAISFNEAATPEGTPGKN